MTRRLSRRPNFWPGMPAKVGGCERSGIERAHVREIVGDVAGVDPFGKFAGEVVVVERLAPQRVEGDAGFDERAVEGWSAFGRLLAIGRGPAFVAPPAGQFGNAPTFISGLRLPFYLNESLSASKRFQIYERANLMFQANFFNAFNRVVFSNGGNPNTFIFNNAPANLNPGTLATSSSVFGQFTAQQNAPRMIQFALKLEF